VFYQNTLSEIVLIFMDCARVKISDDGWASRFDSETGYKKSNM